MKKKKESDVWAEPKQGHVCMKHPHNQRQKEMLQQQVCFLNEKNITRF